MAKSSKIRHIVRLHQVLLWWKIRAPFSPPSQSSSPPPDVPKGHVAVCVGPTSRRYVVRAAHLNHPVFGELLDRAEEEYGFDNVGPLSIPCDESDFEQILHHIMFMLPSSSSSSSSSKVKSKYMNSDDESRLLTSSSCCHRGRGAIRRALQAEARPLLRGFAEKSLC